MSSFDRCLFGKARGIASSTADTALRETVKDETTALVEKYDEPRSSLGSCGK